MKQIADPRRRANISMMLWVITVTAVVTPAVAPAAKAQVVRGQVVDSVTGAPLGGTSIALLAQNGEAIRATLTDAEGLFLLRAPGGGEYRLRVAAAGYRESVFPGFSLGPDSVSGFMLLVAPIDAAAPLEGLELARTVCPASPERPIALGIVRDAAGDPVGGAVVTFSWQTMPELLRAFVDASELDPGRATVTTDASGFYAMCGLPAQTSIAVHAARGGLRSQLVTLAFSGDSAWVGSTAYPVDRPMWRLDLGTRERERWGAHLEGMITDARSGSPVAGASVEVASTTLNTLTDSAGVFRFDGLPSGYASLGIHRVGYRPRRQDVELIDGRRTVIPESELRMDPAPRRLEPIVATADAPETARPLAGFFERRARGLGSFVTREEFEKQGNPQRPTDVLARMQGVAVRPNTQYHNVGGPRWIVRTSRGLSRTGFRSPGVCSPIYFLDGAYVGKADAYDVDIALPFGDIVAVEAYTTLAGLPQEFNRAGAVCGVILFWTGR